jgi:hypothetical protein
LLNLGAGLDLQETADYRGLSKDGRAGIIAQKRKVKKGSLDQRNRTILTDLSVEIGGVAVLYEPLRTGRHRNEIPSQLDRGVRWVHCSEDCSERTDG